MRSSNLQRACYMSVPTRNILYIFLYLIFTTSTQVMYFQLHFTNQEAEYKGLNYLSEMKQLMSSRPGVQTQFCTIPSPSNYHLIHIQLMQCLALFSVTSTLWRSSLHPQIRHIKCTCVLKRQQHLAQNCTRCHHHQLPCPLEFASTPNDATAFTVMLVSSPRYYF